MAGIPVSLKSPTQLVGTSRRSLTNTQSGTVRPLPVNGRRTSSLPTSPRIKGPSSHREQCQHPRRKAATTANISTIGDRPGNNNNHINSAMSSIRDHPHRGAQNKIAISKTPHHNVVQLLQAPVDDSSAWVEEETNYFTRKDRLQTSIDTTKSENKMAKSQSEPGRKPRAEKRRAPIAGVVRSDEHHIVLSATELLLCESCSKREMRDHTQVDSVDTKTQSLLSIRQQAANSANALRQLLGEMLPTNVFHSPAGQSLKKGTPPSPQIKENELKRKGSDMYWEDESVTHPLPTRSTTQSSLENDCEGYAKRVESVATGIRKTIPSHKMSDSSECIILQSMSEATNQSPSQSQTTTTVPVRPLSSTTGRFDCTNCQIGYCDNTYHPQAEIDRSLNDVNAKPGSQISLKSSALRTDLVKVNQVDNCRTVQITRLARVSNCELRRSDESSSPATKYARASSEKFLNKYVSPDCLIQATDDDSCETGSNDVELPLLKTFSSKDNKEPNPVLKPKILKPITSKLSPEKSKNSPFAGFSIRKSSFQPGSPKKIDLVSKISRQSTNSKMSRYQSSIEIAQNSAKLRVQQSKLHSTPQNVKAKVQVPLTKKLEQMSTAQITMSRLTCDESVCSSMSFKSAASPTKRTPLNRSEFHESSNSSECLSLSATANAYPKLSRIPGPLDSPRAPVGFKHEAGRLSFRPISPVFISDLQNEKTRISHLDKPTTCNFRASSTTETVKGSECDGGSILGRQIWMLTGGEEMEIDHEQPDGSRESKPKSYTDLKIQLDSALKHNFNSANSKIPLPSARTPRLDARKVSKLLMHKLSSELSAEVSIGSPHIQPVFSSATRPTTPNQMALVDQESDIDKFDHLSDKILQKGISRMQQMKSAQEQAAKIRQRIYDQELAARMNNENQDQILGDIVFPERETFDQEERSSKQNLDPEILAREKQKHFAQAQASKMRQRIFDQEQAASLRRDAVTKQKVKKILNEAFDTQLDLNIDIESQEKISDSNVISQKWDDLSEVCNVHAKSKLNTNIDLQEKNFDSTEISQQWDKPPKVAKKHLISVPIPAPRSSKNLLVVEPRIQMEEENSVPATGCIQYEIPIEKELSKIPSPQTSITECMVAKRGKHLATRTSNVSVASTTISVHGSTTDERSPKRPNKIERRPSKIPSRSTQGMEEKYLASRMQSKSPAHEYQSSRMQSKSPDHEYQPNRVQSKSPAHEYQPNKMQSKSPVQDDRLTRMQSKSPVQLQGTKITGRSPDYSRPTRIPSRSPCADHSTRIAKKYPDRLARCESSDCGSMSEIHVHENSPSGSTTVVSRNLAILPTRITSASSSHNRVPLTGILGNTSQQFQQSPRLRTSSRSPISFRTKHKEIVTDSLTGLTKNRPLLMEPRQSLSTVKTSFDHNASSSHIVFVNRPQSTSSAYIPSFITVVTSNSTCSSKIGFGAKGRFSGTTGFERSSARRNTVSDASVSISSGSSSSDPIIQVK